MLFQEVEERMIAEKTSKFQPYRFKIDEIEGFKYRAQTALNSLQKKVIKDARLRDIKEVRLCVTETVSIERTRIHRGYY